MATYITIIMLYLLIVPLVHGVLHTINTALEREREREKERERERERD